MYPISKFPILLEKAKWPRLFLLTLGWRPRKIGIYRKKPWNVAENSKISAKVNKNQQISFAKYLRKLGEISPIIQRNLYEMSGRNFSDIFTNSTIFPQISIHAHTVLFSLFSHCRRVASIRGQPSHAGAAVREIFLSLIGGSDHRSEIKTLEQPKSHLWNHLYF